MTGVPNRMRTLVARERKVGTRLHAGSDSTPLGVDFHELVDAYRVRPVWAVGKERRVESHRQTPSASEPQMTLWV